MRLVYIPRDNSMHDKLNIVIVSHLREPRDLYYRTRVSRGKFFYLQKAFSYSLRKRQNVTHTFCNERELLWSIDSVTLISGIYCDTYHYACSTKDVKITFVWRHGYYSLLVLTTVRSLQGREGIVQAAAVTVRGRDDEVNLKERDNIQYSHNVTLVSPLETGWGWWQFRTLIRTMIHILHSVTMKHFTKMSWGNVSAIYKFSMFQTTQLCVISQKRVK